MDRRYGFNGTPLATPDKSFPLANPPKSQLYNSLDNLAELVVFDTIYQIEMCDSQIDRIKVDVRGSRQ
jgi:hypothetical protein